MEGKASILDQNTTVQPLPSFNLPISSLQLEPVSNPNQTKVDSQTMNLLMQKFRNNFIISNTTIDFEPVGLIIAKVTRNGKVRVKFNQPLYVPDFIEQPNKVQDNRRQLENFKIPLNQIDVDRDIFGIRLVIQSDVEPT